MRVTDAGPCCSQCLELHSIPSRLPSSELRIYQNVLPNPLTLIPLCPLPLLYFVPTALTRVAFTHGPGPVSTHTLTLTHATMLSGPGWERRWLEQWVHSVYLNLRPTGFNDRLGSREKDQVKHKQRLGLGRLEGDTWCWGWGKTCLPGQRSPLKSAKVTGP